jgi:hypothetical protein
VDRVDFVAIKENPFRKRRFSGINMRADTDVTHLGNVDAHIFITPYIKGNPKTSVFRDPKGFFTGKSSFYTRKPKNRGIRPVGLCCTTNSLFLIRLFQSKGFFKMLNLEKAASGSNW